MDAKELPTDVEQLKALLRQTQATLATKQRELEETRCQATQFEQQASELSATISAQRKKLAGQRANDPRIDQALRGKTRERIDPDQLLLFELGELETLIEEELQAEREASRPGRKKKRGRRLIPDHIPTEVIEYTLAEKERLCPIDGQPMPLIRWEESTQLDYVPASIKKIVHRRGVYACPAKHDEAKLVTAPKPPQPIEKGLPTAGLLSQVVVSKFGDHLPGYRQEDIFSRHGIEIRRSTIYSWLAQVADLCQPLYQLMVRQVLASKVIHTDDTQVKLIDRSTAGTKLARFWGYLGDANHPYAVYDFTSDRSRAGPQEFLADFKGYLQADAYGGYDGIYSSSNDPDSGIVEVACWVHCRRYWHKAKEQDPVRAHHVLAYITRLQEVERATRQCDAKTRQAQRAEHAVPLLAELGQWLEQETFLPKSLIGKAATYTRNQWTALNRYVEDGDLSMDNNFAERAMRPIAIGRKNWLFVGSERAGHRAAILTSLVASCKNNFVEPWAYLKDVFDRLACRPATTNYSSSCPTTGSPIIPTIAGKSQTKDGPRGCSYSFAYD
jgi:transposase